MVYHYQHGALLNPVEAQAYERQAAAARAMLAALRAACPYIDAAGPRGAIAWTLAHEAIAAAEAAGIKAEG
jgi:hypothetical protein